MTINGPPNVLANTTICKSPHTKTLKAPTQRIIRGSAELYYAACKAPVAASRRRRLQSTQICHHRKRQGFSRKMAGTTANRRFR